ncbi:hypothetical protein [Kribbella sp. NBC_00889]|uniref:hypothetical protein n=1 Tax=Kribbella sp. NBC_00889 TaxID=2975974 RepID=UPI00386B1475|nr:hypothetical protein OG817_40535 [Kribbella sp. NBC_00889]
MFTATLRGMLAHKLRLVLTVASIALGVSFLAGTLVLTDTMRLAFDQLFGKAGLFTSLYGGLTMKAFGPSLLAILVGIITLLPVAARPLASPIGIPLRLRGLSGELARQNAMRNPRRTASTAAALMIGLTLVVSSRRTRRSGTGPLRSQGRRTPGGGCRLT